MKRLKISGFKVCYRPLLTSKHIDARLAFCLKYRDFDWTKVVFSDESMFQMHPNSIKMLGKKRKILQKPKFSPKFMVWVGISVKGKTDLKICKKNMNSSEYILTLTDFLLPKVNEIYKNGFVFQHDNAPCHKSMATRNFLTSNDISTIDWPPNSPDLAPIENCWGYIKQKLSKVKIKNLKDLEAKVMSFWDDLDDSYLTSLVTSMKNRIELCIEAKGKHIAY